jgi:hypothetical protein
MLVFYGTKIVPIGVDQITMRCPSCEVHTPTDLMVYSRYFHIYFLPISPYSKEAYVVCNKCGSKRSGLPFDRDLFSNYNEIRSRFRHPFYTYAGVAIFGGIILLAMVMRAINGQEA